MVWLWMENRQPAERSGVAKLKRLFRYWIRWHGVARPMRDETAWANPAAQIVMPFQAA